MGGIFRKNSIRGGGDWGGGVNVKRSIEKPGFVFVCDLFRARIVIRYAQVGHQMYILDGDVKKPL